LLDSLLQEILIKEDIKKPRHELLGGQKDVPGWKSSQKIL